MKTALCLVLSLALASAENVRLMESRHHVPHGWVEVAEEVDPSAKLELKFFLNTPSEKFVKLQRELLVRSDPKSKLYSQWLTNEQVHEMSAPYQESIDTVIAHLTQEFGVEVTPRTMNSDILSTEMTVAEAEKLLSAKYKKYKHVRDGNIVFRCESYSLPENVAKHVALVGPTTHLPKYFRPMSGEGGSVSSNNPDNLRSIYGVGDVMGGASSTNKQAVTAFLGQFYSASDEATFFQDWFPAGADVDITLVGDATSGEGGVESMLDIEYMPSLGGVCERECEREREPI
jgi:tripeptidyl-peptidase I